MGALGAGDPRWLWGTSRLEVGRTAPSGGSPDFLPRLLEPQLLPAPGLGSAPIRGTSSPPPQVQLSWVENVPTTRDTGRPKPQKQWRFCVGLGAGRGQRGAHAALLCRGPRGCTRPLFSAEMLPVGPSHLLEPSAGSFSLQAALSLAGTRWERISMTPAGGRRETGAPGCRAQAPLKESPHSGNKREPGDTPDATCPPESPGVWAPAAGPGEEQAEAELAEFPHGRARALGAKASDFRANPASPVLSSGHQLEKARATIMSRLTQERMENTPRGKIPLPSIKEQSRVDGGGRGRGRSRERLGETTRLLAHGGARGHSANILEPVSVHRQTCPGRYRLTRPPGPTATVVLHDADVPMFDHNQLGSVAASLRCNSPIPKFTRNCSW